MIMNLIYTKTKLTMEFQILSDIHIEKRGPYISPKAFVDPKTKYIILVGDIGSFYDTSRYVRFVTELSDMFEKVFLIFGNNEYYERGRILMSFRHLRSTIRMIFDMNNKVQILDDNYAIIGDYMLYGSVLWSELPSELTDDKFEYWIRYKNSRINIKQYNQLYQKSVRGLIKSIKTANDTGKTLIVATHFPPTDKHVVTGKRFGKRGKYLYVNHLDKLLKKNLVHTWVFGHTHINVDIITTGGTRLVSNQFGSKIVPESGFTRDKVIRID